MEQSTTTSNTNAQPTNETPSLREDFFVSSNEDSSSLLDSEYETDGSEGYTDYGDEFSTESEATTTGSTETTSVTTSSGDVGAALAPYAGAMIAVAIISGVLAIWTAAVNFKISKKLGRGTGFAVLSIFFWPVMGGIMAFSGREKSKADKLNDALKNPDGTPVMDPDEAEALAILGAAQPQTNPAGESAAEPTPEAAPAVPEPVLAEPIPAPTEPVAPLTPAPEPAPVAPEATMETSPVATTPTVESAPVAPATPAIAPAEPVVAPEAVAPENVSVAPAAPEAASVATPAELAVAPAPEVAPTAPVESVTPPVAPVA